MGQYIDLKAADGGTFRGYLALPAGGRGPGLVVEQEIFGINANVRETCEMFAQAGYVALAPDLFWRLEPNVDLGYTEADWKRAFDFLGRFDVDRGIADCQSTIQALRARPECSGKVGAVGYCLGGKLAYLTACRTDADAAVGYYGVQIETLLGEKAKIKKPLMLHFAERDKFVPMEAIEKVKTGLAGMKDVEVYSYPNVDHAFARFNGDHYDKAAADLANGRTLAFFKKHLG
jgi:carboxymethylenebutenolidase